MPATRADLITNGILLFQGITHQVYLKPDEFVVLTGKKYKLVT